MINSSMWDQYLIDCILKGLAPYDPRQVISWFDDIDRRKIVITTERFPHLHFTYTLDIFEDLEKQYYKIGQEIKHFLFHRSAKPVDDHIILGSE